MTKPSEKSLALLEMLRSIKPKLVPCSQEVRDWWEKTALPTLKAQALSELQRNDEFMPRLVGFMKDGTMGVVDVASATGGTFGSAASKDATAVIHKVAAMVGGTYASVFCVEAWALHSSGKDGLKREVDKYPNLGDHPDRSEVVMFQMLHYEVENNTMMQLQTMVETIKVLGANRSRAAWRATKFGQEEITDPLGGGELRLKGRFIVGDPENPS